MLARKIAQKKIQPFSNIFFFDKQIKIGVEGPTHFFHLLIFHRGRWGLESKKLFVWPKV